MLKLKSNDDILEIYKYFENKKGYPVGSGYRLLAVPHKIYLK